MSPALPCPYCGELLAPSHTGVRSHYERYHPETDPEYEEKRRNMTQKEIVVERVENRLRSEGWEII